MLFRIMEYLLTGTFFFEILCMKILFCLCVELILIYMCYLDCYICFYIFWHPIDSRHNTTIVLELTGSNISLC
jgi:hypothetical protein